jgi:hypothetical protein
MEPEAYSRDSTSDRHLLEQDLQGEQMDKFRT